MKDLIGYYDFLDETQHIVSTAELIATHLEKTLKHINFKSYKYPYNQLSRTIRNDIEAMVNSQDKESEWLTSELISDIAEFVTPFLKDLIEE